MIVAAVPAADLVVAVGGELMLIGDGLMLGESEAGLLLNTIAEVL